MDDLPELPFEQVLSYLNLEDRLKARTVSRAWRNKFDRYPVKALCYSSRPIGFIREKNRWVSGAFAKSFINSTRFTTFFDTFSQTILSSLKRLRLCDLHLTEEDPTTFARTLNSFSQLEELDIIRAELKQQDVSNLNLPMLTSIRLDQVELDRKLTLEAPKLREVAILYCSGVRVEIVHGESVERLFVYWLKSTDVKKLKNLQYLYVNYHQYIGEIDSTHLSSLQQLKEIHLGYSIILSDLFEQKQRSGRADLKIYLWGLLLNGPHDPAINALNSSIPGSLSPKAFVCLLENPSRQADVIPFYRFLNYSAIEGVAPGLEVDLLKKFTHLDQIQVDRPVRDIQRFLDLLKRCKNLVGLRFWCVQPQELIDGLLEHPVIESLGIHNSLFDLSFLFRLKHLIHLYLYKTLDSETVRKAFEELPVLSSFEFSFGHTRASIRVHHPKQFKVSVGDRKTTASDLNAAIEFIFGDEKSKKRKSEALE